MMWPNPFNPYEGGPTVIEWLKQVCDKFNELLTDIKNVRELPAGGSHGQVPTPKEDGSGYEWVDQSGTPGGGGGGGDVTASGNNVFTGTNHFEGLTVLAETHVPTAKDDNDATNKLYVDTLVSNTKKTTVDEVNAHTDERVNALRVLPAGGTSGQVPTIAPDGSTVEWKTPDTSGGGGGGDVTASGNNVFTGTNHFEGLTVLAETHVPTAKDDNDATNKLYVDTLVSNTKKTTVDEVNAHTDERVNALRVLPAGGTSGQVPTIAPDGSTVEWKTPDTSGGGSGGGGVEWVEVALTNGANTAGEVHLFYDKADNTHLKMVGYFTSSSNLQTVSFTLPDPNPIDYGQRVVAALPTSSLNMRNSIYMTGVSFRGTSVTIESYTAMSSSYYRFVGTEFYVVTSAPQTFIALPKPTLVPLPDPTMGD